MLEILGHSFLATLPIYFFFLIGFILRYQGKIEARDEKAIVYLTMDVAYPCLIFYNMMRYALAGGGDVLADPLFCLQAMSSGFLEMLIGVLVAYMVARLLRMKMGEGLRTFVVSAGLQNYVFFVIPLLQILSMGPDDPSMGVLFVHNIGCEVFVWTLAVFLMSGKRKDLSLGAMLRAPLLAVAVSLLIVWLGLASYVAQPAIMSCAEMMGAVATPVSLVLCGCSIYDIIHKASWQPAVMGASLLARLVLSPVFILLMAWVLPVDPLIKRIIVIQSTIPSAITTVMLARRFGGKPDLGMQVVLITTILCLLTMPLWLMLGDYYIVPIFPR